MAADIRQHFTSIGNVLTTGLDSLANNTSATSAGQLLGTAAVSAGDAQGPFEITIQLGLNGSAVGNTLYCEVYLKHSRDGTNYTTDENDIAVGAVLMNQTTAVRATIRAAVWYPHVQVRLRNASGAALAASGNTVAIDSVSYDQA